MYVRIYVCIYDIQLGVSLDTKDMALRIVHYCILVPTTGGTRLNISEISIQREITRYAFRIQRL